MNNQFILLLSINAYLDPGSGSFLFQMVLAVIMGALITIRLYWTKITPFWHKQNQYKEPDQDDSETDSR